MTQRSNFAAQVPSGIGEAFAQLVQVADQDPEAERMIEELLGVVVEATAGWRMKAAFPAPEREAWEAMGARFGTEASGAARARRLSAYADLIANSVHGDAAVADLLQVDRTRISQRVGERSLYSFQSGDDRLYPRWQFVDHKVLRGLKTVLSALDPALHPLVVDHWFTTPSVDLEVGDEPMTPVAWLETGGSPEHLVELVPGA